MKHNPTMSFEQEVSSYTSILIRNTTQALHTGVTEVTVCWLLHQLSSKETQSRVAYCTAVSFPLQVHGLIYASSPAPVKNETCKEEQGHVLKCLCPSRWGKLVGVNPGGQCSASQHLLSKGFSYRLMPFRLSNVMP